MKVRKKRWIFVLKSAYYQRTVRFCGPDFVEAQMINGGGAVYRVVSGSVDRTSLKQAAGVA